MVALSTCALACLLSASNDTVLLEFTADWCGACRAAEPTVRRMTTERFPVRQVNVDRERDLAARFRVTSVPCFVLLVDGQETDRVEGAASYARLVQMFERAGAVASSRGGAAEPREPSLVRGQSENKSPGFSLPRPLASLAKGFGGRSRAAAQDSGPGVPGVVVTVDPPAPQDNGRVASTAWANQPLAPTTSTATSPTNNSSAVEAALRASVRIRVEDATGQSVGSGTMIDSHGAEALVVTCGHLFRESGSRNSVGTGRIAVELFATGQPRSVAGTLISCDLDRDIALVAISPGTPVTPARVAPPGIDIQRGHAVFSVGCDRGSNPTVRESSVSGIDRYVGAPNFEVAGMPIDGRSGGGLFTNGGFLIGICNAADPQDREGIYAALPIIHWELDKIGQRQLYESPNVRLADAAPRGEPRTAPPQELARARPMPRDMPGATVSIRELDADSRGTSGAADTAEFGAREGMVSNIGGAGQQVSRGTPPSPHDEETEVICIVRSRRNPQGNDQLLVVDRPSREFLDRLAAESQRRVSPGLAVTPTVHSQSPSNSRDRLDPSGSAAEVNPILRAQSTDR